MFQSVTEILFSSALSMQKGEQKTASEFSGGFEELLAQSSEISVTTDLPPTEIALVEPKREETVESDDSDEEADVADVAVVPLEAVALDHFVHKISFHSVESNVLTDSSAAQIVQSQRPPSSGEAEAVAPLQNALQEPKVYRTSTDPAMIAATPPSSNAPTKIDPLAALLAPSEPDVAAELAAPAPLQVAQSQMAAPIPTENKGIANVQQSQARTDSPHRIRAFDATPETSAPTTSKSAATEDKPTASAAAGADAPQVTPDTGTTPDLDWRDNSPVEVGLHIGREARAEATAVQSTPIARPHHADPREISRHLAEKLSQSEHNHVELTLTPEELGKVRMVITPGDSPSVAVYADNRETLDFLRRNADLLSKELRDTGFGGASLSFGDNNEGASKSNRPSSYSGANTDRDVADIAPAADKPTSKQTYGRHIDMRV